MKGLLQGIIDSRLFHRFLYHSKLSAMLYPITFQSILKNRVWGGSELERLYQKPIPPKSIIGESWELSDREGSVSVIVNGDLAGQDIQWLVEHHSEELLGQVKLSAGRFPLLCKLLDAQERLSLQVHPSEFVAKELGGESKTEIWYVAAAKPEAVVYAGFKRGVTKADFEALLKAGRVETCLHVLPVKAGDALYVPSGRLHALGSGIVIFEIQQNSDTTYRVFDWNRACSDGKPRALHIEQAMRCIDFNDHEPALVDTKFVCLEEGIEGRWLVQCPAFSVQEFRLSTGSHWRLDEGRCQVLAVVNGIIEARGNGHSLELKSGSFCLMPAGLREPTLKARIPATVLVAEPA